MIEFLFVSIALRFLLFEHDSFGWFRFLVGKIFFFTPKYWEALKNCAYCNGFWVSLLSYLVVFEVPHQPTDYCRMFMFGVVGSWANYFIQLKLNIVEAHPVNQVEEKI